MAEHLIFDGKGELIAALEQDDNLPDWFFKGRYINIRKDGDKVEWVPPMGPAPCWRAKASDFATPAEMFAALAVWWQATY